MAAAAATDSKTPNATPIGSNPPAGPHVPKNKVVLVSIDGWGVAPPSAGNAITAAKTPNLTKLSKQFPYTEIDASGLSVGLPRGVMGNSEVGHLTMGCGRVDFQDLVRITQSVDDKTLETNPVLVKSFAETKSKTGRLHLLGLVSDGGVHSHIDHIKALLAAAQKAGIPNTFLHFFADGRDTPPMSGTKYVEEIVNYMASIKYGQLATVIGRYYAMDRDSRWERIQTAYDALCAGVGAEELKSDSLSSVINTIKSRYAAKESDEFLKPILVNRNGLIGDGDTLLFFDYRSDRMRQIVETFGIKQHFTTTVQPRANLSILQMTQYNADFPFPILFPPQSMANVLSEWISKHDLNQFHTAETEKYAHVTFFFNGGREKAFTNEYRHLIPSPKVATYDLAPEMSMTAVGAKIVQAMAGTERDYAFIMCNLAAPDMVGHTGVYPATVIACEACDRVIGDIWAGCEKYGYVLVITADHGNAEEMLDATGKPKTSHTTNFVPLIVAAPANTNAAKAGVTVTRPSGGGLKDVAPTVLAVMGLSAPTEMTGASVITVGSNSASSPAAAK